MESAPPIKRRSLLVGTAAAAMSLPLAGCSRSEQQPAQRSGGDSTARTTAPPEGDAALLAMAERSELALLGYCIALTRRGSRPRAALARQRDRQQLIVTALRDAMTDPVDRPVPRADPPDEPEAAVRRLTGLLSAAEAARQTDCLASESGPLARLFASISASHAVAVEQARLL